ncbi:MAG: hypothetical protein E8G75_01150 [Sulfitobacter sp. SK025]|nr:MAG: hypothetical protein E8G75_01150 [Sulfitobacter sp. SK025]
MFAARALERAGIDHYDLPPYQRDALSDLIDGLDEEAIAAINDSWTHDEERLLKRGRGYHKEIPAKPRIDVSVEMTSKGNFKAEWFPTGYLQYGMNEEPTDFLHFYRKDSRTISYGGRPSNELFFIRKIQHCVGAHRYGQKRATSELDTVLLVACNSLVERLKERLEFHFEVCMTSDLFLEWEEVSGRHLIRDRPDRLLKWEIDSPAERQRLAELAYLDDLEDNLGFSEAALIEAKNVIDTRPLKRGQEPSPHNYGDRIAKELKKSGFPATKGNVERALTLIQKHRRNAKVIQLNRPN